MKTNKIITAHEIAKENRARMMNMGVIVLSAIIRLWYILITDVGVRQHDLGTSTNLYDNVINPGHLGYVEYLVKFRALPDFNPFSVFSYYHPPLHHIVAAFFLKAADMLGFREPEVYEAIQIPTFIYGVLTVIITYLILKELCDKERRITLPLLLVAVHPGLVYMTGSINNDMMGTMFTFLCIFFTIRWIKSVYQLSYLILMALSVGFGIIAKPNVGVMAIPMGIIMLMHMIDMIKSRNTGKIIGQYVLFGVLSLPIGLSWTIRNFILFREHPGIPAPGAHQYIADYPLHEIFGLPTSAAFRYPFHAENAVYCHNAWQIMFKTSLFTEIWPDEISPLALFFCQLLYVFAVILGLTLAVLTVVKSVRMIRQGNTMLGTFILSGYASIVLTYIAFVIKYPYTCSCDFRYIAVSLLYASIAMLPIGSTSNSINSDVKA